MLTDLRLRKYLEGRLSRREAEELEALLEKSPDLKARLEAMRDSVHAVGRPMWERLLLSRDSRRGSRVRYGTLLPALVILILVLILTSQWFGKPGGNSAFVHFGGNSTAVDLLYDSDRGWRYLDAGFRAGDSLTFAVKDSASYSIRVFAVMGGNEARAAEIPAGDPGRSYGPKDAKPVFPSRAPGLEAYEYLALVFDTASVAEVQEEDVAELLYLEGGGRGGTPFQYQVFRIPGPGA